MTTTWTTRRIGDPPPSEPLTGKEFESLVMKRLDKLRSQKIAHVTRYGVKTSFVKNDQGGADMMAMPSLPDFEGLFEGRQVIFDTKVCSQSKFDLNKYSRFCKGPRRKQLTHMYERNEFGAVCFFLIHFNGRELKTFSDPPETWAIPVTRHGPFWSLFEMRDLFALKRKEMHHLAMRVPWNKGPRERILRPDMEQVFHDLLRYYPY